MEPIEVTSDRGAPPAVTRDVLMRVTVHDPAVQEPRVQEITCPRSFRGGEALAFIGRTMYLSEEATAVLLLNTCLGPEGYALLLSTPEITSEHIGQVITECRRRLLGELEVPKGR